MRESTAGNITVATVAEGGSLTIGGSRLDPRLVGADGRAIPFPCDGTLPRCSAPHTGPVPVEGPAAVTLASPLVCDAGTGECLSDLCVARFGAPCANGGRCEYDTGTCSCMCPCD